MDYREILKSELEIRISVNPRYSLRAFARDLGMSAGRLSHVIKGDYGLSEKAAKQIAFKLHFPEEEANRFCELVKVGKRRARSRAKSQSELKLSELKKKFNRLSSDHFHVVSDWYHLALLEYFSIEGSSASPETIASEFEVDCDRIKEGIDRLIRLNMLTHDRKGYLTTGSFFVDAEGKSSRAIQCFHQQVIQKSLQALVMEDPSARFIGTVVLGFDPARVLEAQKEIERFQLKFNKKMGCYTRNSQVFALSVQFFNLTKKEKRK
jgi:uncharacterized protein (TIGR02147 family)